MMNLYDSNLKFETTEMERTHMLRYRNAITVSEDIMMAIPHDNIMKHVRERIQYSILDFMNTPRGEFLREAQLEYNVKYMDEIPLHNHGRNDRVYSYELTFVIPEKKFIDYILIFE